MNNPAITASALSQFFEISSSPFSFIFLCIFGVLCFVLLLAIFSKKTERLLKKKDGSFLQAEVSFKMLPDGNVMGITRDITERKRIEEKFKNAIFSK